MSIISPKSISIKATCCLYNDYGLEEVFNRILKPYYILRVKKELDVLDKSFYSNIYPFLEL